MSRARGHRRGRGGAQEEESNERWLLTYADMITLLMALFMVLFSISSVNISKYQILQHSLKAAFSGNILPGGKSIAQQGATNNASHAPSTSQAAALVPLTAIGSRLEQTTATHSEQSSASSVAPAAVHVSESVAAKAVAQHQQEVFAHIKAELDAYAKSHGFANSVKTAIERQGLVIRVLTDDLLFASGQATLNPRANGLLKEIGQLLNVDSTHPIDVEGNTDDVPIHSSVFPSNWELSTARASTVVRFLVGHGVSPRRLTATGYADQHPLASDATPAGRTRNRRVEIVMQRVSEGEAATQP
jgi:chemotaxis protein MotB